MWKAALALALLLWLALPATLLLPDFATRVVALDLCLAAGSLGFAALGTRRLWPSGARDEGLEPDHPGWEWASGVVLGLIALTLPAILPQPATGGPGWQSPALSIGDGLMRYFAVSAVTILGLGWYLCYGRVLLALALSSLCVVGFTHLGSVIAELTQATGRSAAAYRYYGLLSGAAFGILLLCALQVAYGLQERTGEDEGPESGLGRDGNES